MYLELTKYLQKLGICNICPFAVIILICCWLDCVSRLNGMLITCWDWPIPEPDDIEYCCNSTKKKENK